MQGIFMSLNLGGEIMYPRNINRNKLHGINIIRDKYSTIIGTIKDTIYFNKKSEVVNIIG